ncbi:MAG: SDR family oxidoreductase [Bellilinea sp.]
MILVTGAAGKTGRAVIKALLPYGEPVRALVRHTSQAEELRRGGVHQAIAGDMRNPSDLNRAYSGVRAAYHICSNMNPDEIQIGQNAIEAAKNAGLQHFVYHSVLHPQVQSMPHHWNKLQVEALLFESGLTYTIMQPAAYMQNVLGYWSKIQAEGVYAVPYSNEARFSLVDLEDVALAVARVIHESGQHDYAIYELCGTQVLSNADIARLVGTVIGRFVNAVALDQAEWEKNARSQGMSDFAVTTLMNMFEYYDHFGFIGNGNVLSWLLRRTPTRFEEFLSRSLNPTPSN